MKRYVLYLNTQGLTKAKADQYKEQVKMDVTEQMKLSKNELLIVISTDSSTYLDLLRD